MENVESFYRIYYINGNSGFIKEVRFVFKCIPDLLYSIKRILHNSIIIYNNIIIILYKS